MQRVQSLEEIRNVTFQYCQEGWSWLRFHAEEQYVHILTFESDMS